MGLFLTEAALFITAGVLGFVAGRLGRAYVLGPARAAAEHDLEILRAALNEARVRKAGGA